MRWAIIKILAQEAVQNLYGVIFIRNNIVINHVVMAFEVKSKIIKEFKRNARIDENNIKVEVSDNTVTLTGKIKNLDERKEAMYAAWAVPGVNNVIDNMN